MTQKYTPAPWHVIEKEAHKGKGILHIVEEVGNQNLEIATMMAVGHEKEFQANARLIAAAPELLEAAEKAIEYCVDLIGTEEGNALIAAIAKAKGKS